MSTIDDGPVTVSADRATVERSLEQKPDGVTAEYVVRATGSSTVEVRVLEELLRGVPEEDVGFHPDHEPEEWSLGDNEVSFEATVAPDESYTTVLGVRTGGEVTSPFVGRPRIVSANPVHADPADVDSTAEDQETEAVNDVDSVLGGLEDLPHEDFEDEFEVPPEPAEDPFGDPVEDDADQDWDTNFDEDAATESTAEDEAPGTATTFDESLAAALVAELEAGRVDDETLEHLRDQLGVGGATAARLDHLQARVEEVAAYADAMETFLDEHGAAAEFAAEIRSETEAMREDLEAGLDEAASDRGDLREDLATDINELEDRIEELSDLGEKIEELEDIEARLESLESDLEAGADERSAISEEVSALADDVGDLDEDIESVDEDLEAATEELESLHSDYEDRIEEIEEEMEHIRRLRDSLQSAFGPAAGTLDEDEE